MYSVTDTGSGGREDPNGSEIDNLVLKYHKGKTFSKVGHCFSQVSLVRSQSLTWILHVQAADYSPPGKEVDHPSALLALNKLTERMQTLEQELADMKFKV